jgi:hypothetical protein
MKLCALVVENCLCTSWPNSKRLRNEGHILKITMAVQGQRPLRPGSGWWQPSREGNPTGFPLTFGPAPRVQPDGTYFDAWGTHQRKVSTDFST